MTRTQANALAARIAGLLNLDLELKCEWFEAEYVNPSEQVLGDTRYSWPHDEATIRAAIQRCDSDVVGTILHECLHVATAEVWRAAERAFEHLGTAHCEAAEAALLDALERHVRKLERALLPTAMKLWREVKKEVA